GDGDEGDEGEERAGAGVEDREREGEAREQGDVAGGERGAPAEEGVVAAPGEPLGGAQAAGEVLELAGREAREDVGAGEEDGGGGVGAPAREGHRREHRGGQ